METHLDQIGLGITSEATPDQRHAAAAACRAILAALEAEPGKPIALPGVHTRPPSPLSGLSTDQVFDLMIAKLRTMVDANAAKSSTTAAASNAGAALRIPMIILPPVK